MRPNLSILLCAASAAVVCATLPPGAARAETLAEAVALAYQTNPAIRASRAQMRALNESYVQARSGFGPQASVEVDLSFHEVRSHSTGRLQGESMRETFGITQPIFSSGRLSSRLNAAEADILAGRERLRQLEADLLLRVIAVYVAVRRDQQILAVSRDNVEAMRQRLEEVDARVEVGEGTRTDQAQAQARLASAQSNAAAAEAVLASTRATYLSIVGRNPADLAPEPELAGLPADIDEAFDAAEAGNHVLLAAKYDEQASRSRVNAARAEHLPNVSLRVQAGRGPSSTVSPDPYFNSVLAQAVVTQPLFTAGLNASRVRQATELNTSDRLSIDSARRAAIQSISQQWSQLAAARGSLVADQANIQASELAFYGMREEQRFGLRSTIELLNAQLELANAQVSFLRNRYTEYVARAALLNQMGRLNVDLVAPGIEPHDAEAEFNRVKNRGALPTEWVVRAVDSIVAPGLGAPRPASETAVPDLRPDLPPPPPQAATVPPLRPVWAIEDEPPGPATPPVQSR